MTQYTALAVVLALLASCTPVSVFYKEGGDISRKQSDLLACEVDALEKAPVASQIRRGPPRYIPGSTYCRKDGSCYRRGGYFIDGEIYTVDANARLRRDLLDQCMSRKGYQAVELPRCTTMPTTTPTTDASPAGSLSRMPSLSETSCVKRSAGGDWQIINPEK